MFIIYKHYNVIRNINIYIKRHIYRDREEELGFTLQKRKSKRVPSVLVHDLDFADDLALVTVNQAQILLSKL